MTRRAARSSPGARSKPLVVGVAGAPVGERALIHAALVGASVSAFRLAMGIGGALAIVGGLISLIGIEGPLIGHRHDR